MRLVNETTANLKAYARKEYYLTKNLPVLVILITEEDYKLLNDNYNKIVQVNPENGTVQDSTTESNAPHDLEEFFPNVACIFELIHNYSSQVQPVVTPILRKLFDIPHFGKYKYVIIIREEKLLEWGNQMDIQVNGTQATDSIRKLVIFYKILTHEFLQVVEREKGIRIFTDNKDVDLEIEEKAVNAVKIFKGDNIFSDNTA